MRAVVQRATRAAVHVEGESPRTIGEGLVVLLGVTHGDGNAQARRLAEKIANLRVFTDEAGLMNQSLLDRRGGMLVISQFTLYADTRRGRRPSFVDAAPPDLAEPLYRKFVEHVGACGVASVATGTFGAHMEVELVNSGPVTVILEVEPGDV